MKRFTFILRFLLEIQKMLFLLFSFMSVWAGLKAGDRTDSQADWMEGKVPVIVATVSFGMGVDKANVRWVMMIRFYQQQIILHTV